MLNLRFSVRAGRVEVSCDSSRTRQLQALRARLATATSLTNETFDVELDDLLVNLAVLTDWPADDRDIRWQTELLRLVESNAQDAATMSARLANDLQEDHSLPDHTLGPDWRADLRQFQRRDLHRLLGLVHGANFSVPGAGKTRVALGVFAARRLLGEVERVLVVCPKSAFETWFTETESAFSRSVDVAVVQSGSLPPAEILLVNYERLPDVTNALRRWLADRSALMILDEAHRMKLGPRGAWGAACLSLGPYASRRLILTGTPAPNGVDDLANILAFVWPGQGRARVRRAVAGRDIRSASIALRPLFVRTTKGELQLPPVERVVRRVQMTPLHRELYRALLGHVSSRATGTQDFDALGRITMYLLMAATSPALLAAGASRHEPLAYQVPPLQVPADSTLGTLLRNLPMYEVASKHTEVATIVAQNAAAGRKTLVWSTFVRSLTTLERLLSSYRPALVHGGTEDRSTEIERFRNDPSCFVLLSNAATLGEGVSLHQECHDAVYVDRDFAAGRFLQSLDRIHRLGLSPETLTRITVLVAEETIDEIVEQRLAIKLRFMGGVLDDPAVTELADLADEPSGAAGMDSGDLRLLLQHLGHAPS